MDRLGIDLEDGHRDDRNRKPVVENYISQRLIHACQCRDDHCRLPSCLRIKRLVQHQKTCKTKVEGNCPTCKRFVPVCYNNHSKDCQDTKCPVPLCSSEKQQPQQIVDHTEFMRQIALWSYLQSARSTESRAVLPGFVTTNSSSLTDKKSMWPIRSHMKQKMKQQPLQVDCNRIGVTEFLHHIALFEMQSAGCIGRASTLGNLVQNSSSSSTHHFPQQDSVPEIDVITDALPVSKPGEVSRRMAAMNINSDGC